MDLQSENYPLPRETYNFIGNDRLVDFLVLSEENNRLHHAYLLSKTILKIKSLNIMIIFIHHLIQQNQLILMKRVFISKENKSYIHQ